MFSAIKMIEILLNFQQNSGKNQLNVKYLSKLLDSNFHKNGSLLITIVKNVKRIVDRGLILLALDLFMIFTSKDMETQGNLYVFPHRERNSSYAR